MEWFEREAIHCLRVVVLVVSFPEHVPLFVQVLLLPRTGVGLNVTRQMRSSNIYLHYSTSIVKISSLPKEVNKSWEIVRREQYVLIIKCHDLLWSANSCCCKSSLGHFVAPRTTPGRNFLLSSAITSSMVLPRRESTSHSWSRSWLGQPLAR